MNASDSPSSPYAAAWRFHRRRQILGVALWIGFLPFMVFVAGPLSDYFHSTLLLGLLFVGWGLLLLRNSLQRQGLHCPRCGRRFFFNPPHETLVARHCRHCGLLKWATPSEP